MGRNQKNATWAFFNGPSDGPSLRESSRCLSVLTIVFDSHRTRNARPRPSENDQKGCLHPRRRKRHKPRSGLSFLDFSSKLIAFAARGLKVEHQVLHVQSQLAEGVLNEAQNSAAATG